MRTATRLLLLPLLLAGCQKAAATPPIAPKASVAPPAAQAPAGKRPTVGILVYEGVQIIDYASPYEVFGQAGFDVFLVAGRKAPLTTAMGQVVTPRFAFADAPALDVLVIPGGDVPVVKAAQDDPAVIAFVRAAQAGARHVMSVCNGAFILGSAGLLDGKTVTTHHGVLGALQALVPSARVVDDQRYVDNGQVVTTAGLSAGMDGALHVVAEEYGTGMAQQIALNLEYDWRPTGGFVRAQLADMNIARALAASRLPRLAAEGTMRIERTDGDARAWTTVMAIRGQGDARAVMASLATDLGAAGWRAFGTAEGTERRWTFADPQGRAWRGVTTATGASGEVRLELHVEAGS
jgi:putative intracellular protease/amidase